MDYDRLGEQAVAVVRDALGIIEEARQHQNFTVRRRVVSGEPDTLMTDVDLWTTQLYVAALESLTPGMDVITNVDAYPASCKGRAFWIICGLSGVEAFVSGAPSGYGTHCALVLDNGEVPIALAGDGATGDIFGHFGSSSLLYQTPDGHKPIHSAMRQGSLAALGGFCLPPNSEYHSLSLKVLQSGKCGKISTLDGGSTRVKELLADETGLVVLRPRLERPWEVIAPYSIWEKAGMAFMTPAEDGSGFGPWYPIYAREDWLRDFDLFVMHEKRVEEFAVAVDAL